MKTLSLLGLLYWFIAGTLYAQMLPQQQQAGESQTTANTQSIQMPSLTSNMFTTSADFFRNLQTQGLIVQPPPYDVPVDTNSYVVGPGDVLNVGVWGATPLSLNLSVTPEGTIIVPTFGALDIGGKTLADAKAYTRKRLAEQFRKSNITLTLIYPRSFYVMVAGAVKTPGRYVVTSFDRVDRAFLLANAPRNNADTSTAKMHFSLRKIKLVHKDGSTRNVDLLKFYENGNVSDDPYLQGGDAIVVSGEDLKLGSISISGAVKMEGTFEYVPGDKIRDLIELSQGLTSLADSENAKVISWDGKDYQERIVNLANTSSEDQPLSVNSRVVVPIDREKINDYYVTVMGEVQRPGIYPISRDSTKLSGVVNLAGGFTKDASLYDAKIFSRPILSTTESISIDTVSLIFRASELYQEDLPYLFQELKMRTDMQEVSTNLVRLFIEKDSTFDRYMRSGDIMYVPRNNGMVYAFGQVVSPGYVVYRSDWNYADYVNSAGGFTDGAETGNVRIIRGGTFQWFAPGETKIEPGDFVFVPRKPIRSRDYAWNFTINLLGTIGAVASIAATVILVVRTVEGR